MPPTRFDTADPKDPKFKTTAGITKVRKRAPKACLSCRARKVRCDVSQRGSPCMNCYLDGETCVVTGRASRLRKTQHDDNDDPDVLGSCRPCAAAENGSDSRAAEEVMRSRLNRDGASPKTDCIEARPEENLHGNHSRNHEDSIDVDSQETPEPQLEQQIPLSQSSHSFNLLPHARSNTNATEAAYLPPPFPSPGTSLWFGGQQAAANADITYSYYPFLSISNLHNVMPQDVNYLDQQGCLRVPTREILDEFMQQYFLHFHPMMPIIDEGDFWDMYGHYGSGGSGEKMSLLVLQAMLFASCNFVSKSSIRALGFPSIRAARATLYRRTKLLYDFDSESDMLQLAQTALMLSHWAPNFTNAFKKANSGWLSAAVQNAKNAEAHHYSALATFSPTTNPAQYKKQRILKRLWWCCVIRDRILSLGMRRSLKITRAHFDFDVNPGLGFADLAGEINKSRVYNPGTKRRLIEIFVQIVELGAVLTDLLTMVFPLDDSPGWGKKIGPEELVRVRDCKIALKKWYRTAILKFPSSGRAAVPGVTIAGGKEFQHDSIILYTNLMYMYYHSSRVALSHHEVLQTAVTAASPNLTTNLREFSSIYENRHELQDAASGVTECLKELIQLRLARWLPISAVAATALPLVLHILDVKLSSHSTTKPSPANSNPQQALKQHRLNILIQAMKTYQPQYDGVDYVSETIRHIVNLTQLDTPAPPSTSTSTPAPSILDWTDILASQPGCYLRLAMTMDLSLSKGRLPEESDFPVGLRGLFTADYSSIKALLEGGSVAPVSSITPRQQQQQQQQQLQSSSAIYWEPNLELTPDMISAVSTAPVLGTVHSISTTSSSSSDTDSSGSVDDNVNDTSRYPLFGEDITMGEAFLDAVFNNDAGTFVDKTSYVGGEDANLIDDWIGTAWGDDEDDVLGSIHLNGVAGDSETARALLDVLRESEAVQCSA